MILYQRVSTVLCKRGLDNQETEKSMRYSYFGVSVNVPRPLLKLLDHAPLAED
jgi:hypothetical protein